MTTTVTVPRADPLGAVGRALTRAALTIKETTPIPYGWRVVCETGEIVAVYYTGKVNLGGRPTGALEIAFSDRSEPHPATRPAPAKPHPAPPARLAVHEAAGQAASERAGWSDEPWDGVSAPF